MIASKKVPDSEKKQKVYEKAKMYGEGMSVEPETIPSEDKIKVIAKDNEVVEQGQVILNNKSLEATLEFDIRETALDQENQEVLLRFIGGLKDRKYKRIIIEGHACAHGNKKINLLISKKRAMATKRFLESHGVKRNISIRYYGEERLKFKEIPSPKNINDPHVRANRRVRIVASW